MRKCYIVLCCVLSCMSVWVWNSSALEQSVTQESKKRLHDMLNEGRKKWILVVACYNYTLAGTGPNEQLAAAKRVSPKRIPNREAQLLAQVNSSQSVNESKSKGSLEDLPGIKKDVEDILGGFRKHNAKSEKSIIINLTNNSYPTESNKSLDYVKLEDCISYYYNKQSVVDNGLGGYPNKHNIQLSLEYIKTYLKESDTVYIYFSGHGKMLEQQDYLVPLGGIPNLEKSDTLISLKDDILLPFDKHCELLSVIIDACRDSVKNSGNTAEAKAPKSEDLFDYLSPKTAILYSCLPGQTSKMSKKKDTETSSLFTKHLNSALFQRSSDKLLYKSTNSSGATDFSAAQDGVISFKEVSDYIDITFEKLIADGKVFNEEIQKPKFFINDKGKDNSVLNSKLTVNFNVPKNMNKLLRRLSSSNDSIEILDICYTLEPNLVKYRNNISADKVYIDEVKILNEWLLSGKSDSEEYAKFNDNDAPVFQKKVLGNLGKYLANLNNEILKIVTTNKDANSSKLGGSMPNMSYILIDDSVIKEVTQKQHLYIVIKDKISMLRTESQKILVKEIYPYNLDELLSSIDNNFSFILRSNKTMKSENIALYEDRMKQELMTENILFQKPASIPQIDAIVNSYIPEKLSEIHNNIESVKLDRNTRELMPTLELFLEFADLIKDVKDLNIDVEAAKSLFESEKHNFETKDANIVKEQLTLMQNKTSTLTNDILGEIFSTIIDYYNEVAINQPEKALSTLQAQVYDIEVNGKIPLLTMPQQEAFDYLLELSRKDFGSTTADLMEIVFTDDGERDIIAHQFKKFDTYIKNYYYYKSIIDAIRSLNNSKRLQFELFSQNKDFLRKYSSQVSRGLYQDYIEIIMMFDKDGGEPFVNTSIEKLSSYELSEFAAERYYSFALNFYYGGKPVQALRAISVANALVPSIPRYQLLYRTICEEVKSKYGKLPGVYSVFSDEFELSIY